MTGPAIRTDIIDVYVFRRGHRSRGVEFLQLRRSSGTLAKTWHPVMGHIEPGETATAAALRELAEETGYRPEDGLLGFWQLERVNTYFLARLDAVMMSPCFAAEADPNITPNLDEAHDQVRWVGHDHVDRTFMWPGQRQATGEILREVISPDSIASAVLRIDWSDR